MATTQTTLDDVVHEWQPGDLIERRSGKSILTECPLCLTDPDRDRHYFGEQENRPHHILNEHGKQP